MQMWSQQHRLQSISLFSLLLHLGITAVGNTPLRIENSAIRAPQQLGTLSVLYDEDGFSIEKDGDVHTVQRCWTDKEVRGVTPDQLRAFLGSGHLRINQLDSGEYTVAAKVPGNGGGPLAGAIAYWATKTICYGTAVAATGALVSGGVGGAALGGLAAVATGGASTAAGITGGIIAGGGLATEAALATTGVIASSGGSLAVAAATIESASVGAGMFFAAMPFLP